MPSADERHSRLPPSLPLQRPHRRATPDERRSDDPSRKPSSSNGSGADSYTVPLLLSRAIIVLAGLAASVPELQSEPMASLSCGATNRPANTSPRMISGQ